MRHNTFSPERSRVREFFVIRYSLFVFGRWSFERKWKAMAASLTTQGATVAESLGLATEEVRGLTRQEVAERVANGQVNKAPGGTNRSYVEIIRQNVFTFINTVLFVIGIALVILGRTDDA